MLGCSGEKLGKAQRQRCALASTCLAGPHLLTTFSAWLNIFGFHVAGAASVEEGSPVDAFFYLVLATAGFCVLIRRQVSLSEVLQQNGWLIAFIAYCFIAILWSDYPFISFKRWIKILGHPIMALIVLTEPDPEEAIIRLMKRCAYIVVPVSILFIKYYRIGAVLRPLDRNANEQRYRPTQKLIGGRLHDPGLFFLLAFAANLAL